MAATVPSIAKPELLVWARKTAGLSPKEVAVRLRISEETVEGWESGAEAISVAQLRRLADVCRRPFAAFFLPSAPDEPPDLPDFRVLVSANEAQRSSALILAVRDARSRRDAALEAISSLGEERPAIALRLAKSTSVGKAARSLREWLGVDLHVQCSTPPEESFRLWRDAVEGVGVFVFQFPGVEVSEARGFCLRDDSAPVIAVNPKDAPTARLFTLLHELVHVVSGSGALCNPSSGRASGGGVEKYCNAVAAETLVPGAALSSESVVLQATSDDDWPESQVRRLSRRYGVSDAMMSWRLFEIGVMSDARNKSLQRDLASRRAKERSGGDYYRNMVGRLGRSYVRIILDAYQQRAITGPQASASLGVKVDKFETLGELAYR